MSEPTRIRKRAVRLTPEALERLSAAVHDRWREDAGTGKFTREARAQILGVSVATSARILAGEGVDRPTLTHVFKNLSIAWEESFCEPDATMNDRVDDPTADLEGSTLAPAEMKQGWRMPLPPLLIAGILLPVLLLAAGYWLSTTWKPGFSQLLAKGSASYHRGDFQSAERELAQAVAIAREIGAGRHLASALRVAADRAAAQGDLKQAKAWYVEALFIRSGFKDDRAAPAILEALGDLETRTGDYANAKEHLEESLAKFKKYGDPVGVAMASRNLGTLAFLQRDLEAAESWFVSSLEAVQGQGKPDIETDIKGRQALILRDRGLLTQARTQLQACLAYWKTQAHPRWIALTQLQLGSVELLGGQPNAAQALLSASEAGFREVGDPAGEAEAKSWLARLDAPGT